MKINWLLLILFPFASLAETNCWQIDDDNERLSCYDSIGAKPETITSEDEFDLDSMSFHQVVDYINNQGIFKLTPHQPNYILPLSYNDKPNKDYWESVRPGSNIDDIEVKFQFSGKLKLWNDFYSDWDMWFGYTQTSWWQLYNKKESAPFRDTNYSPEFIVSTYPNVSFLGFDLVQADYAFIHQSNGRSEPYSRSWNRVYANFEFVRDDFVIGIKPWYRIPEDDEDDDNPDINDYLGYGEVILGYKDGGNFYSMLLRNNISSDSKGAVELNAAVPIFDTVKLYAQYYYGYGESLIDYDHRVNRFSIGILIYDVI
ncbi:phospholipase A [Vibrio comitans]|uniref:Phospholipase A1 n=1 Tax=Vibrio comitans NBRC 102076 TaxID=1219078 RepID=A0A4Y3IQU4_9VIBR|nr:phospholipase A [Vibrio comitans]GEA61911.1 phospholipase [Vibrio comitans NBRC 102076]